MEAKEALKMSSSEIHLKYKEHEAIELAQLLDVARQVGNIEVARAAIRHYDIVVESIKRKNEPLTDKDTKEGFRNEKSALVERSDQ